MTTISNCIAVICISLLLSCANRPGNQPDQLSEGGNTQIIANDSLDHSKSDNQEDDLAEGELLYALYCLTCHQANGTGVPRLNPPLKNTEYVLGDKERLIRIVLNGSREGLNVDGTIYSNDMPPYNFLSDKEISDLLTFIRNSFGNKASAITIEEVKQLREQ